MSEEKTIDCQGEGCGRQAREEDEDYYTCGRCGWAGSSNNPVVVLERKVDELQSENDRLRKALQEMLNEFPEYSDIFELKEEEE
tara:strand:+ start:758 stop:1009 length:252 start_codon:yes stop_codon:yes gene_type:complete